jgi:hypothetical protein
MKSVKFQPHLQRIALICLVLPSLFGCAALSPWIAADPSEDANDASDPVAAAAARFRNPASLETGPVSSEEAPIHSTQAVPEHIRLGMNMSQVHSIWGEPGQVESDGNPSEGNQRWTYYSGLSSRWGLGARRVVYFENGHVAGWKNAL